MKKECVQTKTCKTCGSELPLSEFHKDSKGERRVEAFRKAGLMDKVCIIHGHYWSGQCPVCTENASLSESPPTPSSALELAIRFHEAYERLAPRFGYETKPETREFDPQTPNGRLMIAVCREIIEQNKDARRPAKIA